jgi:hypothetical protein
MSLLSIKSWNKLLYKKNLSGKEALEAVKKCGCNLRFVTEQTREICEEAVKNNIDALQYVEERFLDKPSFSLTIESSIASYDQDRIMEIGDKFYKLVEL